MSSSLRAAPPQNSLSLSHLYVSDRYRGTSLLLSLGSPSPSPSPPFRIRVRCLINDKPSPVSAWKPRYFSSRENWVALVHVDDTCVIKQHFPCTSLLIIQKCSVVRLFNATQPQSNCGVDRSVATLWKHNHICQPCQPHAVQLSTCTALGWRCL